MATVRNVGNRRALDSRWATVVAVDLWGRQISATVPVVGARFGSRVVVRECKPGKYARVWCACDCGTVDAVDVAMLRKGRALQCRPCGWANRKSRYNDIIADAAVRSMWCHRYTGIVSRCYNPQCKAYKNYGARGITMCKEWRDDMRAFLRYGRTLPRWDELGLDLDRIDNNGNYGPGNLRCVSREVSANNRRNSKRLRSN